MASTRTSQRWGALGLYVATSVVFFGLRLFPRFSTSYLGTAADPADPHAFFWFLHWWPYAIEHGINPMVTHLVWSPTGFSVATATSVPLAALLAWPITAAAGPVVSYNVLMLLFPALSAWTAYLLYRHVSGAFLPSLVGGYLYGFSSYELAHLTTHPNLSAIFVIPLIVLLVVRHVRGEIRVVPFTVLLTLALVAQFLLSTELFATVTMFGAIALAVWLIVTRDRWRGRLREGLSKLTPILVAYAATTVLVLPFLVAYARYGPFGPPFDPLAGAYQTDLLNLVVPTSVTALGGAWATGISSKFVGGIPESGAYLGIPLLVIAVLYARRAWRTATGKLLTVMLVVITVATLGSVLVADRARTIPMPWTILRHVPVIRAALPVRLQVYLFLVLGMVLSLWLAAPSVERPSKAVRWSLAGLAVIVLFPNLASSNWHGDLRTPAFFADGSYQRYIAPGEDVLVIPAGRLGAESLRWQIDADDSFRLTAGYLSVQNPPEFECWPILRPVRYGDPWARSAWQLGQFLRAKGVDVVVLWGPKGALWRPLLEQLGMRLVDTGGVTVARVPSPSTLGWNPPGAPCPIER
jgi:hypothetical protein